MARQDGSKKKIDGPWFRMAVRLPGSPFGTRVMMEYGDAGLGLLLRILCDMMQMDGFRYKWPEQLTQIAYRIRCDENTLSDIVNIAISEGFFVVEDDVFLISTPAIEMKNLSEIGRESAAKMRRNQEQNEQNNRVSSGYPQGSQRVASAITKHNITKHDKKKQQQERGMQGGKQTAFFGEKNSLPTVANFAAAFFGDLNQDELPGNVGNPEKLGLPLIPGKTELLPEPKTIPVAVAEMPDNYETTNVSEASEFAEDENIIGSEYIDEVLDKIIKLRSKSKGVLNPGGLKRSLLQSWRENPVESEAAWADEIARAERLTSKKLARERQILEVNEAIERRIDAERNGLHVEDPADNEPDTILSRFSRLDKENQHAVRAIAFEMYRKNPENTCNVNFYSGKKIPTLLIAAEIKDAMSELFGCGYDP